MIGIGIGINWKGIRLGNPDLNSEGGFSIFLESQKLQEETQNQGGNLDSCRHRLKSNCLSSVKSLSCVRLFATPWTRPHHQLPEPTQTHVHCSVMPCNRLILCRPLLLPSIFPSIRVFSNEQFFASGGQSIGVSASASDLPMNIQDRFPLGWIGWISLQCKGLSSLLQHHSSKASILRCSAFFRVQLFYPFMTTGKIIALTRWTFVGNVSAFNMLFRLAIAFLPRSKHLLISWL